MSMRVRNQHRPRPPTPHPIAGEETWVWSALGGLKVLNIAMEAGQSSKAAGKRKAEADPPKPSRSPSKESESSDQDDDIAMIVMNFDGTLTRGKLFMRDPTLFASTTGFTSSESLRGFASMTTEEHIANFGGESELAIIKAFLSECRNPPGGGPSILVYIICDGKSKACNHALKEVGLHGLVTGVVGSNDEPFASESDVGKWAAVEMLQKQHKLNSTQVLWVASKDPDVQSVAELGIASLQIDFDLGFVNGGLEEIREATGLLSEDMEQNRRDEAGASELPGMDDFLQ